MSVALHSQARKSECCIAQTSSCIARFNVLNMRYVRTGNQGFSQLEVIFIILVVTILGMVTVLVMVSVPMIVTILLMVDILVYWSLQYQFAISYNTVRYRRSRWVTILGIIIIIIIIIIQLAMFLNKQTNERTNAQSHILRVHAA